jgi:hypothetical protein
VADEAGAELELDAAPDDATALDDGPEALLSLEQPATPATIVAAPTASNSPRFTQFSFYRYRGRVIRCAYRR